MSAETTRRSARAQAAGRGAASSENEPAHTVPLFSSLAIRNYRLFWTGGLISNTGTWMARVAQDWLVLTILTQNSAAALGLVTGLQFLPTLLVSPWAGSIADRMSKRKLLMYTQTGMALTASVLAVLVIGGWVQLWQVFLLSFVQGIAAAFDAPARQSFAPEMVPPHLIGNAVGLNTTSFNTARLIGPAVAGMSIAWWGVGPALAVNAASFIAVLAALWAMSPAGMTSVQRGSRSGGVREGLRYVRARPEIMLVMFMVFMLGTFGMNFQVTNALMATTVFKVGPVEFGYMSSVMAIGSITAGLLAARRTHVRLRLIVGALTAFTVLITALALVPTYWAYLVVLLLVGLAALTTMTSANTSVQLATEPAMRGRVMALYMTIFSGGTPIGAPLIGWIGDVWGPRWALAAGGIACGIAALVTGVYLLRRNDWNWPWHHQRLDELFVEVAEPVR